jgi:hypothetical protein
LFLYAKCGSEFHPEAILIVSCSCMTVSEDPLTGTEQKAAAFDVGSMMLTTAILQEPMKIVSQNQHGRV